MTEPLDPIALTPAQRKELRRQARRAVGRVSQRLHFVLLFSRGHSPAEIAALIETAGVAKAALPLHRMATLAILAGAFIGFGSAFWCMAMAGAGYAIANVGLAWEAR